MKREVHSSSEIRAMAESICRADMMDGLTCRKHCFALEQKLRDALNLYAGMIDRMQEVQRQVLVICGKGECDNKGDKCVACAMPILKFIESGGE